MRAMGGFDSPQNGFGTTSQEWLLLQHAYQIAVAIAQGDCVEEDFLQDFRRLDESNSLVFSAWWNSRAVF